MYYELYIDLFFLENFMMDSLILLAVNRIMKCGAGVGRVLLGGASASALTCLVTAVPFPAVIKLFLFHIVISGFMLAAGLGIRNTGQFVKAFVLLWFSAVCMGGMMQILRPHMRYMSVFYAAAVISWFAFTRLWRAAVCIRRREETVLEVEFYTRTRTIRAKALWDTGNRLVDGLTGSPVNVLDPAFAREAFEPEERKRGIRYIPFRCVGGESAMQIFRVEKMCIHMEGEYWIMNPVLGISGESFSCEGEYQMILSPGVLDQ